MHDREVRPAGVDADRRLPRPTVHKTGSGAGRARRASIIALALLVYALLTYGSWLGMPFIGDDYIFLDEVMWTPFSHIWSFDHAAFQWYRPWSRELHFWTLHQLAGPSPGVFRLTGFGLWIAMLLAYRSFVGRFTSVAASWMACIGSASLALWGAPLLWPSGCQDLWMLALGFLYLNLIAARRDLPALALLLLALLSKENAVVFPLVAAAYVRLIDRESWGIGLRRLAPSLALTVLWVLVHPTLIDRVSEPVLTAEQLGRPGTLVILVKNLLAAVNLHVVPSLAVPPRELLVAGLSIAVLLATQLLVRSDQRDHPPRTRQQGGLFIVLWIVLGWMPTHLPSIGWHSYYGALGAMGIWAGIGRWVPSHRPLVTSLLIAGMVLLRAGVANTPSWDWGSEWYVRRAGHLLSTIESKLKSMHAELAPHTRVFFARIPNNIGLVAGSTTAVRAWYGEPSLRGDYQSNYRPRSESMPAGRDLFVRFDSLAVLVEVHVGPEDVPRALQANREWTEDHIKLAMLFLRNGQPRLAADQFEKVASLPHRSRETLFAAVCRDLAGDRRRAESLYVQYQRRTGVSRDSIGRLAGELIRAAPLTR